MIWQRGRPSAGGSTGAFSRLPSVAEARRRGAAAQGSSITEVRAPDRSGALAEVGDGIERGEVTVRVPRNHGGCMP